MALLSLVPLLSVWLVLVGLYEHLHAVGTDDSNLFGAADDSAAFGAYPPPGAALCFGRLGCARLAAARCFASVASAEHIGPCQPLTHLYILPAHLCQSDAAKKIPHITNCNVQDSKFYTD